MNHLDEIHKEVTNFAKKYQLRRNSELSCPGLNVSQAYALGALCEEQELRMSEIAQRLCVSLGSATKTIDSLESKGLVRRKVSKEDKRSFSVSISPRGRTLYVGLQENFRDHLRSELSEFSSAQINNTLLGLRRVNAAIDTWREKMEPRK